jgi:methyl-accepting chemotaxis protein
MKSIKTQLIIYFSILILLSAVVVGFVAISNASDAVEQEVENGLIAVSTEGASLTQARVNQQKRTLEIISAMDDIQSMDWDLQRPILLGQVENTGYLDMAVVTFDGKATYSDGSNAELGERGYIKKTLKGESNVSDVIVSKVTNDLVMMYAVPIERNGKVVGALIGRKDGNALSEITNAIKYGEKGYAYLINEKGVVLAHPNIDQVFDQVNPIEQVKEDKTQQSRADLFQKMITEKKV